ncbi:MAG TPA: Rap1a/Tai family immunity protein [Rhizomicrobium sp.]|jgi:hypothetical protein
MKKFLLVAAIGIALASTQAHASSRLRELCKDHPLTGDQWCNAYMAGVAHGLIVGEHFWGRGETCVPNNVDGEQARVMLNAFMTQHPDVLNEPDAAIAARALLQGFGCQPPSRY